MHSSADIKKKCVIYKERLSSIKRKLLLPTIPIFSVEHTHIEMPGEVNSQGLQEVESYTRDNIEEQLYNTISISKMYTRDQESKRDLEQTSPENKESGSDSNTLDEKSQDQPPHNLKSPSREPSTQGESKAPPAKVGLLHPSISHLRMKVLMGYLTTYLVIGCAIIFSFSIYWGALYDREGHQHRLQMLVVIDSDSFQPDNDIGLIGSQIKSIVDTPEYKRKGTWTIVEGRDAINEYFGNPENITHSVLMKVHKRKFWSATYVLPNATYNEYLRYKDAELPLNSTVKFFYETGRDITSVTPYVVSTLKDIQRNFTIGYGRIANQLVANLTSTEKAALIDNNSGVIATTPIFTDIDYRPYDNNVLLAPLQVGLIYLIIVSFFLFNFFADIHRIFLPYVHFKQYILYRIIGAHLSYFIVSLFIASVSAIYQVDFTKSFGKGGFVVYWLSTYLTMAAVGGANENAALIAIAHQPLALGIWLMSFVILNVSPSFSPMALTSVFYRYGYMMPIHHSNEIFKVTLMGLWKGDLGLNYGVIVAWNVLNTILFPICLTHFAKTMAKKAKAAAAANQQKQ